MYIFFIKYTLVSIIYIYLYKFIPIYTNIMTNIQSKTEQKKVQTHIDEAFKFLDLHLPSPYANEVVQILKENGVEIQASLVRKILHKKMKPRLAILNALLLLAKKNQQEKQLLETNLN